MGSQRTIIAETCASAVATDRIAVRIAAEIAGCRIADIESRNMDADFALTGRAKLWSSWTIIGRFTGLRTIPDANAGILGVEGLPDTEGASRVGRALFTSIT